VWAWASGLGPGMSPGLRFARTVITTTILTLAPLTGITARSTSWMASSLEWALGITGAIQPGSGTVDTLDAAMWRVAGITMAGVMNEIGTEDTVVAGDTDTPAKGTAEAMLVTATVAAMDFAAARASMAVADSTADRGFMGAADSTGVDADN
jgi:hypothetical protein